MFLGIENPTVYTIPVLNTKYMPLLVKKLQLLGLFSYRQKYLIGRWVYSQPYKVKLPMQSLSYCKRRMVLTSEPSHKVVLRDIDVLNATVRFADRLLLNTLYSIKVRLLFDQRRPMIVAVSFSYILVIVMIAHFCKVYDVPRRYQRSFRIQYYQSQLLIVASSRLPPQMSKRSLTIFPQILYLGVGLVPTKASSATTLVAMLILYRLLQRVGVLSVVLSQPRPPNIRRYSVPNIVVLIRRQSSKRVWLILLAKSSKRLL